METEIRDYKNTAPWAKQTTNTMLKFAILSFFKKNLNAKFVSTIIADTLSCKQKEDVKEVLESLVKDEIIEKHVQRGVAFYCLTSNPDKRQLFLSQAAELNRLKTNRIRKDTIALYI